MLRPAFRVPMPNVTAEPQAAGTASGLLDSSGNAPASHRGHACHGNDGDTPHAPDDAPTTPVVYLVRLHQNFAASLQQGEGAVAPASLLLLL
jgi:hypothetical protein